MGRSKRLQAWQMKTKAERLNEDDQGQKRANWHGLGVKQSRRLVRDTRDGRAQNNWLHGVLFVVLALIIVAWALGY